MTMKTEETRDRPSETRDGDDGNAFGTATSCFLILSLVVCQLGFFGPRPSSPSGTQSSLVQERGANGRVDC